jgi:predicted XRE-type DNA-binding protein
MDQWVDPIPGLKRQLADEVLRLSDGWSQSWAAFAMHLPRSRASALRRGKLENISLERQVLCLSRIGYRTEFTLVREPPKRGRLG